jgi:hypothetical protein
MKMKVNLFLITSFLFISNIPICFSQKLKLDSEIIGRWERLYSIDTDGNKIKDDFSGKGYIETFTKNGTYLLDPNYFRDDMKRHGINEPLDYSALPVFRWKTISESLLEINYNISVQQVRYGFSGDTLLMGEPNGAITYLLKRGR